MKAIVRCTETTFLSSNDLDSFTAWFDYHIYINTPNEIRNKHSFCFDWDDFEEACGKGFEFPTEGHDYEIDYEIDVEKKKIKLISIKETTVDEKWLKQPEEVMQKAVPTNRS